MARQGIKAGITQEYLAKFPNTHTLTLAKKIYKENKKAFADVEDARSVVRRYRGQFGDKARKEIVNKENFVPLGKFGYNPYKLPESHSEEVKNYQLPIACNNILAISDLHVPYHNVPALTAAIDYGIKENVNTIIINGDLIDFHQLSRFEKDPRARSTKEEFDTARAILEILRKKFPTQKIIWLCGNHDKRYEKWLYAKAPEIFDDEYYKLEERLRLNELKIEYLNDDILIKAGKLFITHGHLVIRGVFAPVNSARGCYMRTKVSTIIGHTHQVSEHTEKDMKGEITTCWSMGCLCELNPVYDPFVNKHAHGFAHIKTDREGNYNVRNFRILNGKIL